MIKFKVNKKLKEIFNTVDTSELANIPAIEQKSNNEFIIEMAEDDFDLWLTLCNEEIVASGMINQDTVNDRGRELYWLYDELLYQSEHGV